MKRVNIILDARGDKAIKSTISYNRIEFADNGEYEFHRFNSPVWWHDSSLKSANVVCGIYDPSISRRRANVIGYLVLA